MFPGRCFDIAENGADVNRFTEIAAQILAESLHPESSRKERKERKEIPSVHAGCGIKWPCSMRGELSQAIIARLRIGPHR